MKIRSDFQISAHAEQRAEQRGVNRTAFWAAYRKARRSNLKQHLEIQQQKFMPMLTDKEVHAKVGRSEYTASRHQISTKMDVDGITFVVGIRREGERGFSPLTVETVWS